MRRVQQPTLAPHRCALIPFKGASNTRFFYDWQIDARELDHMYVSEDAAVAMARDMGWVPAETVDYWKREYEAERAENARLGGVIADLEKFRDAAEYTLGALGQKVRAKPGRKPAERSERVAA